MVKSLHVHSGVGPTLTITTKAPTSRTKRTSLGAPVYSQDVTLTLSWEAICTAASKLAFAALEIVFFTFTTFPSLVLGRLSRSASGVHWGSVEVPNMPVWKTQHVKNVWKHALTLPKFTQTTTMVQKYNVYLQPLSSAWSPFVPRNPFASNPPTPSATHRSHEQRERTVLQGGRLPHREVVKQPRSSGYEHNIDQGKTRSIAPEPQAFAHPSVFFCPPKNAAAPSLPSPPSYTFLAGGWCSTPPNKLHRCLSGPWRGAHHPHGWSHSSQPPWSARGTPVLGYQYSLPCLVGAIGFRTHGRCYPRRCVGSFVQPGKQTSFTKLYWYTNIKCKETRQRKEPLRKVSPLFRHPVECFFPPGTNRRRKGGGFWFFWVFAQRGRQALANVAPFRGPSSAPW